MNDFVLIDLTTQQDQVAVVLKGQTPKQVLDWLRQFGEVKHISHSLDNQLYGFVSKVGIRTGFRLTEQGDIIVLGYHTTQTRDS